ncbi:MAG: hypothetical protein ABWY33_06165 [Cellulomonas sp.]
MAMNADQLLAQAARTLREHTDTGWVALRDDVVAAAVRAFRPSAPVRGRLPGGELWVASAALVARVRSAVAAVPDAGALRITCATTSDHELDRLTVEIVVLYGTPVVPLADEVRRVAAAAVADALGLTSLPLAQVHVDVSVEDVTNDHRLL